MKELQTMRVQEIKRRLDAADYAVDTVAVARAIMQRPAARQLLLADLCVRRGSPRAVARAPRRSRP